MPQDPILNITATIVYLWIPFKGTLLKIFTAPIVWCLKANSWIRAEDCARIFEPRARGRRSSWYSSSSFSGLPYRILNMKPKKELLWGGREMMSFSA